MGFIDEIKARAKADKKTIVLPETEDERTYKAAETVLKEGIADLILIGKKEDIEKNKGAYDISGAAIVDPATNDKTEAYIAKLVELRQKKGMTEEQARDLLMNNYIYYGVMMVKMGDADGMVSGACHSTADTLRPCLQILKTKPGTKLVSAFFLMVVPDCDMGANGTFIFGDAGLEQNPDPEKLANIAISSAESFRTLTGKEPIVAMLSHSTKGSAKHPDVDKVVEATKSADLPGSGCRKHRLQAGSETWKGRGLRTAHTGNRSTGQRSVTRMQRRGYRGRCRDYICTGTGSGAGLRAGTAEQNIRVTNRKSIQGTVIVPCSG